MIIKEIIKEKITYIMGISVKRFTYLEKCEKIEKIIDVVFDEIDKLKKEREILQSTIRSLKMRG